MGMGVSSSASRRGKRARRAAMAEINVTPLVDVMLVLLIIFMVTVTLPAVGVPVELPESRAAPVEEKPDQITISIDRQGVIYIENEAVPAGRLPEALAALERGGEPPLIVLQLQNLFQRWKKIMAQPWVSAASRCRVASVNAWPLRAQF